MDRTFYLDVNNFAVHTAYLHGFMRFSAVYLVGIFGFLVLAAWWFARQQRQPGRSVAASIWAAGGTLAAVGINQPITHAVARPRPYNTIPGVEVLVARAHDYTFPSDHAITAGAATAGLWIVAHYGGRAIRWLAAVSTVFALFIAFARVYVGAHYPGDVAAGLVIGAAIVVLGWLILKRPLTAVVGRFAEARLTRPLVVSR